MNCKNCGAPIASLDSNGNFHCDFCHTRHAVSDCVMTTRDGANLTGNALAHLSCPRCEDELELGALDGMEVAVCADCHGVLLQRADFSELVTHRRSQSERTARVNPMNPEELRVHAACPKCERKMDTYPYAGPGAVVMDLCLGCDLVWIDSGEITRIETAPGSR